MQDRFFTIRVAQFGLIEADKWWFFKMLWNRIRFKKYTRKYAYFIICNVTNNKKVYIGDRFIAGNYYPPVIFEVVKKLGQHTITARSLVIAPHDKPDFVGKAIILTKNPINK